MRNPYQRDKKPGRVGGDPLKNVVGEAAGVKGQQVQVGKVGIESGVAPTVKMGQSSSFTTSTGLVNALDVVKGVSNVMSGVNNVMDAHDKMRASQMEKDISDLTSSEQWTNNEAEGYLSDDAKNEALQGIYKNYENSFTKNKGRAWYQGKVADTNIQYQNLGFEREMARLQLDAEKARAEGNEEAAATNFKSGLDLLRKKYAGDSARINQIEGQDLVAGAKWATAVQQSVELMTENWKASGGLEFAATTQSTDMGYENWRQAAIADMAVQDKGGLGEQLFQSYNIETGEFEGPYAEQLAAKVDSVLMPVYNQAVGLEAEHQKNNHFAAMGSIPRATVSAVVGAGSQGSGNAESRQAGMNQVASDGIARMLAFTGSSPVPLAPWQKRQQIQQGLSDIVTGVYKVDPSFTSDQASSIIDQVISDNETELISQLLPHDATEKEKEEFLRDMRLSAKADLKVAKQGRAADVDKQTRSAEELVTIPITNTGGQRKQVYNTELIKLAEGTEEQSDIYYRDAEGEQLRDTALLGMTRRASNLIYTAGFLRGENAEQIHATVEKYNTAVQAFLEGGSPETLTNILKEASEGSPYIVKHNPGGFTRISWDPNLKGNVPAQTKVALGLLTQYMAIDPDSGFYRPKEQVTAETFHKELQSLVGDSFRSQAVTEEVVKSIDTVVQYASSIFEPTMAAHVASEVIVSSMGRDGFKLGDTDAESLQSMLTQKILTNPTGSEGFNSVYTLIETALRGRNSIIHIEAGKALFGGEASPLSPEAGRVMGAALGWAVSPTGDVRNPLVTSLPREFRQSVVEKMWFDTIGDGFDDESSETLINSTNPGDLQQVIKLAMAGKPMLVQQADKSWTLAPKYQADPTATSKELAKRINGAGLAPVYQRDEDGNIVGVVLQTQAPAWEVDANGVMTRDGTVGVNFTGRNSAEAIAQGMEFVPGGRVESSDMKIDRLQSPMYASRRGSISAQNETKEQIFYHHLIQGGVNSGRSRENVEAWASKPSNRASIAGWTRPARNIWIEPSRPDRLALSNQITATIEDLNQAGAVFDSSEAESFAALLKNKNVEQLSQTDEGLSMWNTVRDIAKAQGYNPENPPMWTVNLAVLATLMPDQVDAISNMSPYDLDASTGFRPSEYTDGRTTSRPDNRRGYDSNIRYSFKNFSPVGNDSTGVMSLPIFAPVTIRGASKGDPRTFVRKSTMQTRRDAVNNTQDMSPGLE